MHPWGEKRGRGEEIEKEGRGDVGMTSGCVGVKIREQEGGEKVKM